MIRHGAQMIRDSAKGCVVFAWVILLALQALAWLVAAAVYPKRWDPPYLCALNAIVNAAATVAMFGCGGGRFLVGAFDGIASRKLPS